MSDQPDTTDDRPDDATLAGEYVLGLVPQTDRRAIEARIAADPAFARLVEDWAIRFQPLVEGLAPVEPPAKVWAAIDTALGGDRRPPMRASFWESVSFWRWTTALASAAALAGFLLSGALLDDTRNGALVAALQSANSGATFLARIDTASGHLVIQPAALQLPADRAPELWVIPGDGRPRSLGVIAPASASDIAVPRPLAPFLQTDATLAVSIEPQGGSPTGLPTGPVIATGKLQRI